MLGFVFGRVRAVLMRRRASLRARELWRLLRLHVDVLLAYTVVLRSIGGLRKYKGQTTRAERLVETDWVRRGKEDGLERGAPLYHLFPCCCIQTGKIWGGPNIANGAEFLNTCKRGVIQYVSLQSLLALLTYVLQANNMYHAGEFRFDDPRCALGPRSILAILSCLLTVTID